MKLVCVCMCIPKSCAAPFQGLGATILRNTPANCIYLGSYEYMKAKRAESKGVKVADLAPWEVILAGGLGGLYYWMATFPVDSIKSALQVRTGHMNLTHADSRSLDV